MNLSRTAARQFADALYMEITRGKIATGNTTVHVRALGGSFPIRLEIVDDFGDAGVAGADAGLLLRGPGGLGVFIGRSCEDVFTKKKSRRTRLDVAILDSRVIIEKTGALPGSFGAYEINSVNGFQKEFASAVKKWSHRTIKEVKWR